MIRRMWNRLDTPTKAFIGCVMLYLVMYVVVDIAEAIAMQITW